MNIRDARLEDAAEILAIYRPIVENTPISFETEVPTTGEMETRVSASLKSHAYLIAEDDGVVIGYAYGSRFRPRDAYKKSAEVTVYVRDDKYGQGLGKALYEALFRRLAERGFHSVLAGICLPNAASVALHAKVGFQRVGIFREVGFKFNKWHDVEWWQRPLSD